jgi:alpha-L-fucosidase 2
VEYARIGDVRLALDATIPPGEGPFPAAILVHGGGWVRGNRTVDVEPLFKPLTAAGIAWFSISYRLTADFTQFGAAVSDVETAIRFVKAHAKEYRIDPERIALIGESAGGQLALMAALEGSPDLRVKAVVAMYAPTDLVALEENSRFVPQWVRAGVHGTSWESLILARLRQLSPIEHVRRDMPPLLLIHGRMDSMVPFQQSEAMCARVNSVGGQCELFPVASGHGMRWWEASEAVSSPYKRKMVQWLKARMGS